jgi:GDP-L-fucose synthase
MPQQVAKTGFAQMHEEFQLKGKTVYVAGHRGLVGQALLRRLDSEKVSLVTASRNELDLRRQSDVEDWMQKKRPQIIFNAAATVGGIHDNNTRPVDYLYNNTMIEANVINAAYHAGVEKIVNLGSTCIYPKLAPQPIDEEALLTGPLEPTNEWYAVAKIFGVKLCQAYRREHGCNYISALPTNLYGPNDNFDPITSHVLPALMRKAHDAKASGSKTLTVWGTGNPLREFLHVDDLADALVFLCRKYNGDLPLNVGSGEEVSIRMLAELVCDVVGFQGQLVFDTTKPDGTPRKLSNVKRLNQLGWLPNIRLKDGLHETYNWFLATRP